MATAIARRPLASPVGEERIPDDDAGEAREVAIGRPQLAYAVQAAERCSERQYRANVRLWAL